MAVISILLLLPIYLINVAIGDFTFFDPVKGENVNTLQIIGTSWIHLLVIH